MSQRFFINPLLFAMCTAGVCTLSTITTAFGADTVPGGNVYQVQNASSKSTSVGEVSASANALSDSAKALASTDGKLTKRKYSNPPNPRRYSESVKSKGSGPPQDLHKRSLWHPVLLSVAMVASHRPRVMKSPCVA